MSKTKPDYTKFMRKPAPLRMNASSESDPGGPHRTPIREEDIPWAEIIEEHVAQSPSGSKPLQQPVVIDEEGPSTFRDIASRGQGWIRRATLHATSGLHATVVSAGVEAPPLPVLFLVLLVALLML